MCDLSVSFLAGAWVIGFCMQDLEVEYGLSVARLALVVPCIQMVFVDLFLFVAVLEVACS